MNDLASPASVESDNALGDVIDSYADPPSEQLPASETSVLVVGAGIVGLSMAIMLAHQGVSVTVCERSTEKGMSRFSPHLLLTRTMEIYRSIGLADDILKESQRWYSENGSIIVMETLTSSSPMATYSPTLNSGITDISPAKRSFVTHHMLLRILRRRVKNLALIKVRYQCPILEVIQDADKVTARFENGQITAKYCIGCDGAAGITRKIVTKDNVTGHGLLTNSLTIVFRANLKRYQRAYNNSLIYISNPNIRGFVRFDRRGESGILVVYSTTRKIEPEIVDERRTSKARLAMQILFDAIGRDDVKAELVSGEDWTARSESADLLQKGRIFLAGDSARQMAPTGSFGGNTGIQDAHNLAWKLSAVLTAKAHPSLLETYHTERHSNGLFTIDQAYKRWRTRCFLRDPDDHEEELPDINVELGQRYNNSRGVVYVSGARGAIWEDPLWPTAFPGSRAPHLWFSTPDKKMSLYEYFERTEFVLLCCSGRAWADAVDRECAGMPLKLVVVPQGEFLSKYKIKDSGAVVIRPDGIIGWKALNNNDVHKLPHVMKQLLGEQVEDELSDLPPIARTKTAPEINVNMSKLEISPTSPGRKSAGSLMRKMTTRIKKKSIGWIDN